MRIRNLFRQLFLSSALTLFSFSAHADLNAGAVAIQNGQFEQAFAEWLPLAEKGEMIAQAAIGVMYHMGQGVPQDYTKAVQWYRRAAEKGNAASQANLGVMYAKGTGVSRDLVQAYVWYDLAATQGERRHARGRDKLAKQLSPEQLSQGKRLAHEYAAKFVLPFRTEAKDSQH